VRRSEREEKRRRISRRHLREKHGERGGGEEREAEAAKLYSWRLIIYVGAP